MKSLRPRGVVSFRNVDWFAWTDVRVVMSVYADPWHMHFIFTRPVTRTVRPREILAVDLLACARPLPSDIQDARVTALQIQTHEGGIVGMGFEPSLITIPSHH